MEHDNSKLSLKEKWNNFFNVIFDPWVIFLLIITTVFIIYSTNSNANYKNVLAIFTLVISLLSGLLGGVIANRWAQMTELKVLVARGKSAIRGLKLILLNISNIEKRTKDYIIVLEKENKEYKLITSNFEEVIEKCNILEEEVISSIENWTDIIPEVANLKTQIGLISDMKIKQVDLEKDISQLQQEILNVKTEEGKQKEALEKKLVAKESELSNTKDKLKDAERKIETSLLSGLTSAPSHYGATHGYSGYSPNVITGKSMIVDVPYKEGK